jgi:hypothetical protein
MKTLLAAVLAIAFLVPAAGQAGPAPAPEFSWSPRFQGKFGDYFPSLPAPGQTDLDGFTAKIGRVVPKCPQGRFRGPRLTVKKQPAGAPPVSNGFFEIFGDPNQKRAPATITVVIDPTKLDSVNSRAVVELDSPFVPIGGTFEAFTLFVVNREADDSLQVFVSTPTGNVGTPLVLPSDTPGVIGQIFFADDAVDFTAKSCIATTAPITIASAVPLLFDGSAGVGAGLTGEKGDSAGFQFAITGDLFDAGKQDVLGDLQAVIDLELAAAMDLANGNSADARTKIEQARSLIETQGPEVQPPTMPATFEPSLNAKVGALPASDARDEAAKRIGKAGTRDAKARDLIDKGGEANLKKAAKEIDKANQEKQRAKAVLETGVAAEAKF